ncbi:MAG: DUF4062 domain-containing protein, partial [Candidatus Thorarchaeota archaeon]
MEKLLFEKIEAAKIRTPDQRLRVFISSSLRELSPEREVVRNAIEKLHLIPVMFESGARPHPPQELYRSYLSQSHIFIGIYWQSYGWVGPEMEISGLEDEYQLAKTLPKLIYIKNPAPEREKGLEKMLERVKGEEKCCYKYFSSLEELEKLVTSDIVLLLSERFEKSMEEISLPNRQAAFVKNNLPQELTTFIGRDQLITSISHVLKKEKTRLVTLTGPGGVGKTRLALKIAAGQQSQHPDGVWLVELASFSDPSLVVQSVADVFGLREEQNRPLSMTLLDYLYDKNLLLILDNCEHLVDAAAQLAETILRGAPGVRILTTSRQPLGIPGEVTRGVSPLNTPGLQDEATVEQLMQYEAVNLFVERAFEVKPDFNLTDLNAAAVANICARLDGIPLAIELAVARLRVLSVEEIATRLDDRFRLLVGNRSTLPRQQTLRALIDWSHDLLTDNERKLLSRLSIFAGGWTVEEAEAVCSGDGIEQVEVLDLMTQLVDKSLVIANMENGRGRYQFLDTIHQFSSERLLESEEFEQVTQRHAEYFQNLAERSYGELWSSEQEYWLKNLTVERDNLRQALEFLTRSAGQEELGLRMAGSLWRFWEIRGYISEGRNYLEHALAINPDADPYWRANALRGLGMLEAPEVSSFTMPDAAFYRFFKAQHGSLALHPRSHRKASYRVTESLAVAPAEAVPNAEEPQRFLLRGGQHIVVLPRGKGKASVRFSGVRTRGELVTYELFGADGAAITGGLVRPDAPVVLDAAGGSYCHLVV